MFKIDKREVPQIKRFAMNGLFCLGAVMTCIALVQPFVRDWFNWDWWLHASLGAFALSWLVDFKS